MIRHRQTITVMALVTITAKDLNRLIDQRKHERSAVFHAIFEMITKKIVKYASNQKYRCIFEVPDFVLGFPLYSITDALKYLLDRLRNDCKLHVKYYFPKVLYISWCMNEMSGKTVVAPLLLQSKTPVFLTMDDTSRAAAQLVASRAKAFHNPHEYDEDGLLDPDDEYDIHKRLMDSKTIDVNKRRFGRTDSHTETDSRTVSRTDSRLNSRSKDMGLDMTPSTQIQTDISNEHRYGPSQESSRETPILPTRSIRDIYAPPHQYTSTISSNSSSLFPPQPISCKRTAPAARPSFPKPSLTNLNQNPQRPKPQPRQIQTTSASALNFRKISEFTPSGKFVLNLT